MQTMDACKDAKTKTIIARQHHKISIQFPLNLSLRLSFGNLRRREWLLLLLLLLFGCLCRLCHHLLNIRHRGYYPLATADLLSPLFLKRLKGKAVLQLGQEAVDSLPGLIPQLLPLRVLTRRNEIPIRRHDEQHIFEVLRDRLLLKQNVSSHYPSKGIHPRLTKLSPCPLFINRSIISIIFNQRSSMPSHWDNKTRYCKNTLHKSDAAFTLVSLIPSRSLENISGLSSLKIRGKRTSPKIEVHSS